MKKVMAFLEKYAEWVAMGFACVFLLYMVYSYVVSPDAVKVEVGRELLMPGEVDPYINTKDIAALQAAMDDKNGDVSFPVPDFAKAFSLAMGPDRDRMKGEFVLVRFSGPRSPVKRVERRP